MGDPTMRWILALLIILVVFPADAADLRIPKAETDTRTVWTCGYTSGFYDAIHNPSDPKTKESEQCAKYREQARRK
jgi:hypothetical protein